MNNKNILIQYWGRKGAGPLFLEKIIDALNFNKIRPYVSISSKVNGNIADIKTKASATHVVEGFDDFLTMGLFLILIPFKLYDFFHFVRARKISLVMCPMLNPMSPFIAIGLRLLQVKYVLIVHDATPHPGEDSFFYRILIRASLINTTKIIVLSEYVKNRLIEEYHTDVEKISVVQHGPLYRGKRSKARRIDEKGEIVITFAGRIKQYKGIGIFINVIIMLREKGYPIKGRICGSGEFTLVEKDLINGNSHAFELDVRWFNDDEFEKVILDSDLLLLPYIEASQSGVVAYALPIGVPVVITPVGGIISQVIDGVTGIVAKGLSEGDVLNAVELLLKKPELYYKISSEQIKENVNNDGWEMLVNEILVTIDHKGAFI